MNLVLLFTFCFIFQIIFLASYKQSEQICRFCGKRAATCENGLKIDDCAVDGGLFDTSRAEESLSRRDLGGGILDICCLVFLLSSYIKGTGVQCLTQKRLLMS